MSACRLESGLCICGQNTSDDGCRWDGLQQHTGGTVVELICAMTAATSTPIDLLDQLDTPAQAQAQTHKRVRQM